jgi:hypothetical protein
MGQALQKLASMAVSFLGKCTVPLAGAGHAGVLACEGFQGVPHVDHSDMGGSWDEEMDSRCIAVRIWIALTTAGPVALRHFSQQNIKHEAGFQYREIYAVWDGGPGSDIFSDQSVVHRLISP